MNYLIGSLLLGTGNTGNVWIVNKNISRDISLVWSGRKSKWCAESEHTDILSSSPPVVSEKDVIDFIEKQLPSGTIIKPQDFPKWVQILMGAPTSGSGATTSNQSGSAKGVILIPKEVRERLAESGVAIKKPNEPPRKRILDSFRESCNHSYVVYTGAREVYEFCAHCDMKRAVKK